MPHVDCRLNLEVASWLGNHSMGSQPGRGSTWPACTPDRWIDHWGLAQRSGLGPQDMVEHWQAQG